MILTFTKMHSCGNDYLYFDVRRTPVPAPESLARTLCPRRFAVGADGIVLIGASDTADASMRIFNADGSEASMCGNAVRCVGAYLAAHGAEGADTLTVMTAAGLRRLQLHRSGNAVTRVTADMGRAEFAPDRIPVRSDDGTLLLSYGGRIWMATCVSVGNPHAVLFTEQPETLPLPALGQQLGSDPRFPCGVNLEFVRILDRNRLQMRVWERGSGETSACGTGACAAAAVAVRHGAADRSTPITVCLPGGELTVVCDSDDCLTLSGETVTVCEGRVSCADPC